MTEADLWHLEDLRAPISDMERAQAAAEIRRLRVQAVFGEPLVALPTLSTLTEWIAALFGIVGAALLATRFQPAYGFAAFLASNGAWIAFAMRRRLRGLLVQQLVFTLTSVVGLWNWGLGPLLLG